ncbi:phosphotransferase family protein [Oceanicella sp. SM1341]|uniref:phosphotransferase family protein n=1 Tax=Oceanicella sp. SM1341 TaxID=1548889 RepID=UPI0018E4FBD6|nr:phosphotransferase family protein [Oceanicella sp. SM1341]
MEGHRAALEAWLAARAGAASARVSGLAKLSGGAIQENWALDVAFEGGSRPGGLALVLRTDAPSGVAESLGRAEEFALFSAAHAAGVTVPEPLWLDAEGAVTGRPLFVMARVRGVAAGHLLVRAMAEGGAQGPAAGAALARTLGVELARIHTITPPRAELGFLGAVPENPGLAAVAEFRRWLDGHRVPHPILEWGLRWLERNAPPPGPPVLCHNDFRTGNYMVEGARLTAVLDWEFAAWGDAQADLGWFCAPCWRFGALAAEAGGIAPREAFYAGYEAAGGRVDRPRARYWEVMATLRWAVIALQQAERHVSGGERSLELALTAHVLPALELDIMEMTAEESHA